MRYFSPNSPACYFMDVKLPKLGEGADSGVVVNVFVKEGDHVVRGQSILELENEKAVASIPSTAAGVVTKIYVKAGDKISIGHRLITIADGGQSAAAAPAAKPAREPAEPAEEPAAEAEAEISRPVAAPVASPSIRKMTRDLGIDLSKVRGSEAGGRIVLGDIRAYIQSLVKASAKPAAAAGAAAR